MKPTCVEEKTIRCPNCQTLETIDFIGDKFAVESDSYGTFYSGKFYQTINGDIHHCCSIAKCRIGGKE